MAAESLLMPPGGIGAGLGLAFFGLGSLPLSHTHMYPHHHSKAQGSDNLLTLGLEHLSLPCHVNFDQNCMKKHTNALFEKNKNSFFSIFLLLVSLYI
jgi:hypothetical protein